MLIEALRPLCIRRSTGDLHLKPGFPVELPDDDAVRLLAKKPDAVLQVSVPVPGGVTIEPAAPNARSVFWETGDGRILGPAKPEFLARDGDAFWISTTFEGQIWWINVDRLRSQKAFEVQGSSTWLS